MKDDIKKLVAEFACPELMIWWPVVARYGNRDNLDAHGIFRGVPFVIEAKAPGEVTTGKQHDALNKWCAAGAIGFVISSSHPDMGLRYLRQFFMSVAAGINVARGMVYDDTVG